MKDKDARLIFEAYTDESHKDIIDRLKQLRDLLPEDQVVNWSISDGSFSSLTPSSVLGDSPDSYTIKALIGVLMKVWSDPGYAEQLGLANADWSGEDNYDGSIFWTANDTHYHDVYGKGYTDEFQRIKPEHKEQYKQFHSDKHLTDNFVKRLTGGNFSRNTDVPTPENFVNQKHWRINLSPRSEAITKRGDATYDSVGYGKGRYMGD